MSVSANPSTTSPSPNGHLKPDNTEEERNTLASPSSDSDAQTDVTWAGLKTGGRGRASALACARACASGMPSSLPPSPPHDTTTTTSSSSSSSPTWIRSSAQRGEESWVGWVKLISAAQTHTPTKVTIVRELCVGEGWVVSLFEDTLQIVTKRRAIRTSELKKRNH